jgi:hypothetical protein
VIQIEPARFDEMVERALDGLPEKFGEEMKNIAVTVEHQPGPPGLLGLYQGIPLTQRGSGYAGVLPDRITIYARNPRGRPLLRPRRRAAEGARLVSRPRAEGAPGAGDGV